MTNQIILWGTLIVPWLSLFFMKKEDIKRFMPTGMLAAFLSIVVCDTGVGQGWWHFRETTFPFGLLSSYVYGLFPIIPMWILKYTYGRFSLFVIVEVAFNIVFAYFILSWFARRAIVDYNAGLIVFVAETLISILMYGFQVWQESPINKKIPNI